ncbi:MAG TPA: hypothetical protein VJR92_11045 [Gemmatimonadaceae bacterium]|nr:hypothetical protein [Gemmatimonadaceae bacterium]
MRILLTILAIVFGLCFAAMLGYLISEYLHNFSSMKPAGRNVIGYGTGLVLQAGLFLAPFQRLPKVGARLLIAALIIPNILLYAMVARSANLARQEQQIAFGVAIIGIIVYVSAVVYVWTRPYPDEGVAR